MALSPLFTTGPVGRGPGVTWYILQHGPGLAGWHPGLGILPNTADLYEEVRLTRSLDLVISVDTLLAHLAGAFGASIWAIWPAAAEALDGRTRRQPLVSEHAWE